MSDTPPSSHYTIVVISNTFTVPLHLDVILSIDLQEF